MALASSLLALAGCAGGAGMTLFGAGSGVAMGTGVDYTLNGIAYRTFTASMPQMRRATLKSLADMDIAVTKDEKQENGWIIEAAANERTFSIELQKLTERTTRMRVVANDGIFFKDRSTETEIITQTSDALDRAASHNKAAKS
ncbi:MAG TPA: DUF3568 family protein [Candidatus Cybelea sp.]|nr:DUF3568 family protein [Candidatus Cybelea sp.]